MGLQAGDERDIPDQYEGSCPICGEDGCFFRDERPSRESYLCPSCRGSLRYQGQARVLLQRFARHGARSVAELAEEPEFRALRIWEPGDRGPLRRYLRGLPGYELSSYWPDVDPGSLRDGVRCEDLMALTFASESFDLIITSDVFEHVRKPYVGFAEVHRVLRPGGAHVFSLPISWPMRDHTVPRVDVSGAEDVFLLAPAHHGVHLVYNDFGRDLLDGLDAIGLHTDVVRFESTNPAAARLISFHSVKAGNRDTRASVPVLARVRRLFRPAVGT